MKLDLNNFKQYKNLELLAKQLVEGFVTGLHKSPYHGFSVEFSEHRLYNSGESTKNIDWKVFARTDKLFTKRFEEETNLRAHLILDVSSSMYYPQENNGKLNFSILCLAAIATILQKQRDALSLVTFSDRVEYQSQIKSTTSHIHNQLLVLDKLLNEKGKEKSTSTAEVINIIASKISRRGLVVLFTDMFDDPEKLDELFLSLQFLKHKKHEILIFHVTENSTEIDFDFDNRPHIFKDLETGEELKLMPSDVKKQYQEQMKAYLSKIELKCNQLKIDYVPIDINDDFEKVLLSYFIKRKKMR